MEYSSCWRDGNRLWITWELHWGLRWLCRIWVWLGRGGQRKGLRRGRWVKCRMGRARRIFQRLWMDSLPKWWRRLRETKWTFFMWIDAAAWLSPFFSSNFPAVSCEHMRTGETPSFERLLKTFNHQSWRPLRSRVHIGYTCYTTTSSASWHVLLSIITHFESLDSVAESSLYTTNFTT